ncbi:hypothetical protein [Aquimarina sp. MMG016]|uniref:hypothetical protein n=1 Tax=Aquimarina sp. MMG016 TaxID=2822690 RepID=UPI001B3A5F5D|nr:hypothetical protein [Aquimarina sp. MMG016]MBQ4819032.1 hypothetical protein [Aquimarina sp. MMG016]
MKKTINNTVLLILLLTLVFSCNEKKKENVNPSLENQSKTEINKDLKKTEVAKDNSGTKHIIARDSSYFCNTNYVKVLQKNIGNANKKDIKNFLLTFDESCSSNAEYGEYSNEVLFAILDKNPKSVIDIISKNDVGINVETICEKLESPINDLIDLKKLTQKIIELEVNEEVKNKILSSLKVALDKYN